MLAPRWLYPATVGLGESPQHLFPQTRRHPSRSGWRRFYGGPDLFWDPGCPGFGHPRIGTRAYLAGSGHARTSPISLVRHEVSDCLQQSPLPRCGVRPTPCRSPRMDSHARVHGEDGQGESPGCPNQIPGPDVCQVGPRKGSVRPSWIGSDQEEISGGLALYSAHQP